ncbi:hypothetical protein Tco_1427896 [Tanacetum coccineum]
MASLDHRLNPLFSIKECSSCGALYTSDYCCSKGGLEDKILVPKPPQNCATCGDPVDGLYCRPCAFVRKCLNEGWYTIHDKNEILNTPESSNHNTNVSVDFNDDSTSSDDDSPYGEDIDYVDASPPDSELVSLEVVEYVTPENGEIEDDILREKLSKINLLIAKIEALKDNPTPSSNFVTKSSSTSLNLFLEETNTFDNSLTESETFCFDLEENSSGSTTTLSDYSLSDYETFYFDDDHIEEK